MGDTLKKLLLLLAIFVSYCFITSATSTSTRGWFITGTSSQTCTERFSDDFNRGDSTTVGNGWVESAGDYDISSNQLRALSANSSAHQASIYTTQIQWVIFDIVTLSSDAAAGGLIALDTAAYTEYYVPGGASDATYWYDSAGLVQSSGAFTWSNGNTFAAMKTSSATNTVMSYWKDVSNTTPWSGGASCTDNTKPCWDNADDAPDLQFTNNPATPADTYLGTGVSGGYLSGTIIDNFGAGDCSE